MEYPVVGSSMAHSDRELRLHHGIQNRIPDAAAHTIAESRQEPTLDLPSCESVSKSLEKCDGDTSGTVPLLDALEYIVVFCSNANKHTFSIKKT